MKIRTYSLVLIACLLPEVCLAQDLNTRILMTVDGQDVQAGEFMRMYKKSVHPGDSITPQDYLKQFIVFKLKVADALNERLDTSFSFRNELNGYRNQLAESYLTDNDTKEKLIRKAYQRSLSEINAWHILIALRQNASPEDTLRAWKKAIDVRERVIKGESFESVARGSSDDKSVKINGGNLGYFSVFQMIMPFEDAAYSLKQGAISMPVRTPYGYHIIKVTGIRPSKGKIKVAHIMKAVPPGADEATGRKAEEDIKRIYQELKNGASFPELARKYSDHKSSAANGGQLDWFGTGEMISDFSEAAFSLNDTGSYTAPVRTLYGWHIIKLLARKKPGTFEESRSFLESKVNQSYLNSISKKSFVSQLRKAYNFQVNNDARKWFIASSDSLVLKGLKKYDRTLLPSGNIYSFANQRLTTGEFAGFIEKSGKMVVARDSGVFINRLLDLRSSEHLLSYENSMLEQKYPEFRYLMNEFHDGMLLFDISGKKVWDSANDSTALQGYYQANKNHYLSRRGVEAKVYSLKSPAGEQELQAAFKKYSQKPRFDAGLRKKFNHKNDTLLIVTEGLWLRGDSPVIDNIPWEEGLHPAIYNGLPSRVFIKKIIEPHPMNLNEIRGDVMTDYQDYLEGEWVEQLNKKYSVKVDTTVLNEVKNKLRNE